MSCNQKLEDMWHVHEKILCAKHALNPFNKLVIFSSVIIFQAKIEPMTFVNQAWLNYLRSSNVKANYNFTRKTYFKKACIEQFYNKYIIVAFRQTQRPPPTTPVREPWLRSVSVVRAPVQPGRGRASHTQVQDLPVQQAKTRGQAAVASTRPRCGGNQKHLQPKTKPCLKKWLRWLLTIGNPVGKLVATTIWLLQSQMIIVCIILSKL